MEGFLKMTRKEGNCVCGYFRKTSLLYPIDYPLGLCESERAKNYQYSYGKIGSTLFHEHLNLKTNTSLQ